MRLGKSEVVPVHVISEKLTKIIRRSRQSNVRRRRHQVCFNVSHCGGYCFCFVRAEMEDVTMLDLSTTLPTIYLEAMTENENDLQEHCFSSEVKWRCKTSWKYDNMLPHRTLKGLYWPCYIIPLFLLLHFNKGLSRRAATSRVSIPWPWKPGPHLAHRL